MRTRCGFAVLGAMTLVLALFPAAPRAGQGDAGAHGAGQGGEAVCAEQVALAETLRPDLPPKLLTAIAKVESGRWNAESGENFAWPWTVMAEGKGRYLPSKAAAKAEVEALRARGVQNIDVGCMQINLYYHGHAFDSLDEALDPTFNVAYAAEFLLHLRRQAGSWTRAIGDYHSRTPKHSGPYRARVAKVWRQEKRAAFAAQAQARRNQAAFERHLTGYLRDDGAL